MTASTITWEKRKEEILSIIRDPGWFESDPLRSRAEKRFKIAEFDSFDRIGQKQ